MAGPIGRSRPGRYSSLLAALGVLLVVMWSPVASANASAPKEVTGAAGGVVESVTDTAAEAVPDVPAPELPPVPVAVPPPPAPSEAPADPPASSPEPAPEPAAPPADPVSKVSHTVAKAVGGGSSHAAVDQVTGAATEAVGAVTGAPPEVDRSTPGEPGRSTSESAAPTAAGDARPVEGGPASSRVEPTTFAPVSWFMARVWPAIALERGSGQGAPLGEITLPEPGEIRVPSLTRVAHDLFLGLKGSRPVSANLPLPAHPAASDRAPTPPWDSVLSSGARIALYVAIAALLALLAFMLRTELSSAPGRPGHR